MFPVTVLLLAVTRATPASLDSPTVLASMRLPFDASMRMPSAELAVIALPCTAANCVPPNSQMPDPLPISVLSRTVVPRAPSSASISWIAASWFICRVRSATKFPRRSVAELDTEIELLHEAVGDRDVVEAVVEDADAEARAVDGVAVEIEG